MEKKTTYTKIEGKISSYTSDTKSDDDLTRCKVSNVEQKFIKKKVDKNYSDISEFNDQSTKTTYVYDVSSNLTFTFMGEEKTYPYAFRKKFPQLMVKIGRQTFMMEWRRISL